MQHRHRRLFLVSALLVCLANPSSAAKPKTIGTWYDDLGSPGYGDSTLLIEQDGDKYFIVRKNGDGSGSRYQLAKDADSYGKIGDKFGAKYKITSKGLEIHDRGGYIRTAKPR